MNKYKINPLLIHDKGKEQTMSANYVTVRKMLTPILNGIVPLDTGESFGSDIFVHNVCPATKVVFANNIF